MAKKGNKSRPQTDAEMMGVINAAGNKVDSNKILEGLIRDYVTNSLSDGTSEGEYASEYGGFDGDADAWFGTDQGAEYLESVRDKLSDSVDNTKVFGGCGTDAGSQISTDSGYNPCSTEFDAGAAEQFLLEQIENASKETSKELYSWNAGDDAAFHRLASDARRAGCRRLSGQRHEHPRHCGTTRHLRRHDQGADERSLSQGCRHRAHAVAEYFH